MRLRFAPSPTGHLHVGNARTALFNWLLARGNDGTFVLRIEDTDVERSTRESERSIIEDLSWMGLAWNEGPDVGGAFGPYRQSERAGIYHEHVERLLTTQQAYYCFCTPELLEQDRQAALAAGQQPKYPGRCRAIRREHARARVEAGEPAAVRFHVVPGADVVFDDDVRGQVRFSRDVIGDPVILRSDGHPAYNFAVVVDDALMKITQVIRGEDHISNTPRQLLLYEAFGYAPPSFAHLSLVLGPDGTPLSKRHGATSVAEFRARGILPEALANYLALIGWSPGGNEEILPLDVMASRFAIGDVGKTAGVFDPEKLAWVNRQYLRSADPARLARLLRPFFEAAGLGPFPNDVALEYVAQAIVPLVGGAVSRLDEAPARVRFVFAFDPAAVRADPVNARELSDPAALDVLVALVEALDRAPRIRDRESFRSVATQVRERSGRKGRSLFHPIRVALTGQADGPELDLAIPAIDRGADLPPSSGMRSIVGCRERCRAIVGLLRSDEGGP
jgi:nondiscriminating glutamyl-tRNA synthetase